MAGRGADLWVGRLRIPARELEVEAVRSGGPGGQNVNKVATQVQIRFNARASPSLSAEQRARIERRLAHRLTLEGELLVRSSRFRERSRNLEDARERLAGWIAAALAPQKARRATRPTSGSRERRLSAKRKRAERKRDRRGLPGGD